MAYRMACDHADVVAGIVSVAGAMPQSSCTPSEALAGLQIHGTADETVLYEGGEFVGVPYPGAEATSASFAQAVGCSEETEPGGASLDLDASVDGAEASRVRHTNCEAGAAAELWTVSGGAHVPAVSADFMSATLDFLFDHPRP
jgi:polyhydroxybutyrate depolymerase